MEKTPVLHNTDPILSRLSELTDNLHFGSDGLGEGSVVLPVILVERIFDRDDGVLLAQILVDFDNLGAGVG
jgi:hypothetical protein